MPALEPSPSIPKEGIMRKLLLIAVLTAVLAAPASATEYGYVGLFADEARSTWCLEAVPYVAFDVFVFALPSDDGIMAVEFSLADLSPVHLLTGTTEGPFVSVTLGDIFYGKSYGLLLCRNEPVLLEIFHMLALSEAQTALWLEGHGDHGEIRIANCLPGYPSEVAYAYSSVFVNYPPDAPECMGVGTEESTWGAIKGMYE
jgi:hypothetical protein